MTPDRSHWAELAQLVKDRRRHLGIPTQQAAADLGDISKNTWQRLENGQAIGDTSLVGVSRALHWPAWYIASVLKEGPDAPRPDTASLTANLPSLESSFTGTVGEPEVRYIYVEDVGTATDSVVGAPGETVVAQPATVNAKASVPGPAVSYRGGAQAAVIVAAAGKGRVQAEARDEGNFISVNVPISRAIYAELEPDDIASIMTLVTKQGREMAEMLAMSKRRERAKREADDAKDADR